MDRAARPRVVPRRRARPWRCCASAGRRCPADAAAFALNVVDRTYLLHAQSADAAGRYGFAAKLSTVVIVAVRGFQAAWPPLAYSVTDEAQAARLYARVTTAYVAVTGLVVCGVTLVGRWAVRALAERPELLRRVRGAAVGRAGLGALRAGAGVRSPSPGRAKVTTRNFPATAAGLVVNVVLLVTLVGPLGIAGAGIALCGAYVVIVAVLHLLTRRLFVVPFEWARLAAAVAVLAVARRRRRAAAADAAGRSGCSRASRCWPSLQPLLVAARVVSMAELRALRRLRTAR